MNTQTHVLLAAAVVGCVAETLRTRVSAAPGEKSTLEPSQLSIMLFIILGALIPDISLYVMFAYAKLTGVANNIIWSQMYYSPFWQNLGAMSNSLPIFLTGTMVCWLILRDSCSLRAELARDNASLYTNQTLRVVFAIFALSLASLLHVVADLPLHHDDGHPHFWPFTTWIFSSPVSYWDSAHYANYWVPVESLLGVSLVVILWRKTKRNIVKGLLLVAGLSYPAFALFFYS